MTGTNDMDLVREYVSNGSEAAFAELVQRHVNLVYSVALRFTSDPQNAEDIVQAVFVILARKAASLRSGTILTGWLYETTRYTAMQSIRSGARRRRYEQEAVMQSTLENAGTNDLWRQLGPLLEDAMSRLNEKERTLMALRFFENKTGAETAQALGIGEWAVRKRAERALEKLRAYFSRHGVDSTGDAIARSLSAHSLQAAPAALVKTITAVALAKGATASASTATLIKGALKFMAWTKAKTIVIATATVLVALGTMTTTVILKRHELGERRQQVLEDGSMLSVDQVSFGDTQDIVRNGKTNHVFWPNNMLNVELKLSGPLAANNPLVKPAFYRQSRVMLHGNDGIEYVAEMYPNGFQKFGKADYYGQIQTGILPRDSRDLWLRVEQSPTNRPYGPWRTLAEFRFPNPAYSTNRSDWAAQDLPVSNSAAGMEFILRDAIVETNSGSARDIWNHHVILPTEVWSNGLMLTNWTPVYIAAADASGNTASHFQTHRSLDPRFIWKLEMDFELASNYPPENVFTVPVPSVRDRSITTNVMDTAVTVTLENGTVGAFGVSMPTNRADLALRLVHVLDSRGNEGQIGGSWSQNHFYVGDSMFQVNGVSQMDRPASVTFAIVPNIRTTFYVQPRVTPGE